MPRVIQQSLKSVKFTTLKRLKDVTINFEGNNVTGIFGPNGCGKSTILHALACIYRKLEGEGESNYFTRFFKAERNVDWKNSHLCANFVINGEDVSRVYTKGNDHWSPRMEKRLERVVKYLGIGSCVPDVEKEPYSRTKCYLAPNADDIANLNGILNAAKRCMQFEYDEYHLENFAGRKYQKVTTSGGLSYSSLAMGAGEQRLFTILQELYSMPAYSLLLIDELDLTLHTSALQALVTIMVEVAKQKNLQIVFTSHREELASRSDINVRHVWFDRGDQRTQVLQKTTSECLNRLTGRMIKDHEIYVEDDLSEAIAKEVLRKNGMLQRVDIIRFGDAANAFSLAASNNIRQENEDKAIFILDGDVYRTEEERMKMMEKYYSGNEADKVEKRREAISHIKQYILPPGEHPEHYLWSILKDTDGPLGNYAKEVIDIPGDQHRFLNEIQMLSGEDREVFLYNITSELSKLAFWEGYVLELQEWLDGIK